MRQFENEAHIGETICFSCAPVLRPNGNTATSEDILRAESALIYTQEPTLNTDSKDSFNYQDTIVNVAGEYEYMEGGIWGSDNGNISINLK